MTETTMTLAELDRLERGRKELSIWQRDELFALARRALVPAAPCPECLRKVPQPPAPTGSVEVTREHREAAESAFDIYNRSELTDLCDAFAQVLATREAAAFQAGRESAQGGWFAVGADSLPDSDRDLVVWDDVKKFGQVVRLECTDDSEGNGEWYWDSPGGPLSLWAFSHWRYLDTPPAPGAEKGGAHG